MVKYSRQREALREKLNGRTDHPTAETLYAELKEEYPSMSIATVYRNLRQLEETGEIISISTGSAMRYDPNTRPHSHFFCTSCGCVMDMAENSERVISLAQADFAGTIDSSFTRYYGLCPDCAGKSPEIKQ